MTPRERVMDALNHREPDKVPIDCGATMCSTLTAGASRSLKSYLGMEAGPDIITSIVNDCVAVPEEILNLFEVDFRTVYMKGPGSGAESEGEQETPPALDTTVIPPGHEVTDEFGTIWRKAQDDYVPVSFSFERATVDNLDTMPWPDPYDPGRIRGVREEAAALRESTSHAIVSDFICGGPFEQAQRIRGFEQFLIDLAVDQKFAQALLEKLTDNAIGFWDAQLSQVADCVEVVVQGDDLGMQTNLLISPETYRRFVKPCHRRLFSFIHSKTKAKLWLHSCGSIHSIIPDLIEVGVDILNPIQIGARNMELDRLKKDFGKEMTFWGGGIDIQRLPYLGEQEIRDQVKRALDIMAPGGGYVFAPSHNILPDTEGKSTYIAYMTAVNNRDY